jgi:hypothetical protein
LASRAGWRALTVDGKMHPCGQPTFLCVSRELALTDDDATKYRPPYYPEYAITVPATATPTIILQMKALGADPGAVAMMPSTSAKMDRTTRASICSVL